MKNCFELTEKEIKEELALYFYGGMAEVYQIKQWLKTIEELHRVKAIRIIVRNKNVHAALRKITNIPVSYIYSINNLLSFYEDSNFKVILYVNNGMKNFQSLIFHRAIHIHLNHGESEKSSMHSNQCKAYDYTYIAGDAALDRYRRHIINIKRANYIKIGRPQLDHISKIRKTVDKTVILYAPTDESTHISMRYTSLEHLGLKIVDMILSNPDYLLIYRPHPSTGKNSQIVKSIDVQIKEKIKQADNACLETSIQAIDLLSVVDVAIFDNSSLIIDFLHFNKPMFATNMFDLAHHDIANFKMLDACIMLDEKNIDELKNLIQRELENDTLKNTRLKIKKYYLGDYSQGESTQIFMKNVVQAILERDTLLKEKGMLDTLH